MFDASIRNDRFEIKKKLRVHKTENILMEVIIKWSLDEQWKLRNDIRDNISWYIRGK